MDNRTREKLLHAARIRMRLLEGRHSGLPAGADWMAALEEGRIASDRLEAEMVRQEMHRVRVLAESLRIDRDAARAEARSAQAPAPVAGAKKKATSHRYPERKCSHCGKAFWPEYFHSAYCSDICRRAADRARRAGKKDKPDAVPPAPVPAVTADAVTDDGMHYCERMRLRMRSPLPCGKRMECFSGTRCERCPEDVPPVRPPVFSDSWGIGRGLPAGDM